jgi:hypothetical protein
MHVQYNSGADDRVDASVESADQHACSFSIDRMLGD